MKLCLQEGITVIAEMTLIQQNIKEVQDVMSLLYSVGVSEFRLMRYVPTSKSDYHLRVPADKMITIFGEVQQWVQGKLLNIKFPCSQKFCFSDHNAPVQYDSQFHNNQADQLLLRNCYAGLDWLSVSSDGSLRLCPHSSRFVAKIHENEICLRELWTDLIKKPVLNLLEKRREDCSQCMLWDACLGGCYLSAFDEK